MEKIHKLIKLCKQYKIALSIILVILLIYPAITLSRFVYTIALDYYFKTKNFYFNSDLLSEKNPTYTISSWSGVDDYIITINMNSVLNDLSAATSDISYDISYKCESSLLCSTNKNQSVIYANKEGTSYNNRDDFTLTATPTKTFINNEEARIELTATSTDPYVKTLKATLILKVEKVGLGYEIMDGKKEIFAQLKITNSLTYYTVHTAFGSYNVGDEIQQEVYQKLSAAEKENCSSMHLTLKFDPRIVQLDMTNKYYLRAQQRGQYTTTKLRVINEPFDTYKEGDLIDNATYNSLSASNKSKVSAEFDYINSFEIDMDAISSAGVMFYKRDTNADYTYPFVNDESIIEIS